MLARFRTWWSFRRAVIEASRGSPAVTPLDRDVVVLPCWRRPELLWHCLDNLTRADGIEDVHVLFRPDTGFAPETLEVIAAFADRLPSYEVQLALPCPFRRTKPSANILLSLLNAAALSRQLVFLVEEDIMVGRDFFRWHRAVQAAADPLFCSISVRNPNRSLALPEIVEGYYLSSGDYCSTGICYDRRILQRLVAPQVNMAYLARPKKYIRRHFPASKLSLGFVEQDGLIRRIQEQSPFPIAWPCVPRTFHAGFFGARGGWQNFNNAGGVGKSLGDRVQRVAETIYSVDAVRGAIDRPEFLDTCLPCDLELPDWRALRQIDVPLPAVRKAG